MSKEDSIQFFENKQVSTVWDAGQKKRYLSVIEVIDILTKKAWAGKTTKEHKVLKGLKKENFRNNMTNTALIFNMLAEASTEDTYPMNDPKDYQESKRVAKQAGALARVARKELESKTGKKVVNTRNEKSVL